jgi:hypothetical protein
LELKKDALKKADSSIQDYKNRLLKVEESSGNYSAELQEAQE